LRFRELALKREEAVQQNTNSAALIDTLTRDRDTNGVGRGGGGGGKDGGSLAPKIVVAATGGGAGGRWSKGPQETGTWQEREAAVWGSSGPFGGGGQEMNGRGGARVDSDDVSGECVWWFSCACACARACACACACVSACACSCACACTCVCACAQ